MLLHGQRRTVEGGFGAGDEIDIRQPGIAAGVEIDRRPGASAHGLAESHGIAIQRGKTRRIVDLADAGGERNVVRPAARPTNPGRNILS